MSFELTSNAPPADWQQFQELFREAEYTDDSNNHFNYCTICLYIIPDLAQAKLIDAPVRDCINKTLHTNIELGGLVCGYCYDNYAKSTIDQSSWPIGGEDDLMSIDDTLFDPEKEQQDQAAVKHHLQPNSATTINGAVTYNNNGTGTAINGLYNVVETSEFFHSHESDNHVLNYSDHDYDASHVTDPSGISDLSAVLPVDVTFSAPAQLYPPHVTPYWSQGPDHVINHVTDQQRVTPVKRRDLNEIASMKLPELKTELKRYRLSTKGTKPQLVQRLFRHLSLFHNHVPGHVPDNAPFIFADLQDNEPWSVSRDKQPNESLTALFEDDRSEQESYLAHKDAQVSHQSRDAQPLDLSSLSLLSLPEIKARLAQYTGASIKGSKAELIQRLVRYSCLFGQHAHKPATLTLDGTELNALPLREDLTSEQLQSLTDVRLVTKNSFKTKKMTQQSAKDGVAPWLKHVTTELSKSTRWSEEELNSLPKLLHWRLLGDILLFTLMSRDIEREQHDETQLQRLHDVAQAFLSFFGQQKLRSIVVESRGRGIGGELRTPDPKHVRLLWSHVTDNEPATTTVHVENGVQYKLDVSHVMYSMGNSAERIRFAHLATRVNEAPELAIDMFAGIGYFTLPLAKYGKLHKLIAIEKNPNSFRYLSENVRLNHVTEIVTPVLGDNREVCNEYEARAQRILMGYLPETAPFLDRAIFFAAPSGVIVHYHHLAGPHQIPASHVIGLALTSTEECDAKFGLGFSEVFAAVKRWHDRRGIGTCQLVDFVSVKNYAPKIEHCVADIKITWSQ